MNNKPINSKFKNRLGVLLLFLSDVLILLALFYISLVIRMRILPLVFPDYPFYMNITSYYWIIMLWLLVLVYNGAYSKRFPFWDELKFLWNVMFIAAVMIFAVLFVGKLGAAFSRALILTMILLSMVLYPLLRTGAKRIIYSLGLMKRKVLILGAGQIARKVMTTLRNEPLLGYEVAGFIDDDIPESRRIDGLKVHRGIDAIDRYIKSCGIHDVLIAKPELEKKRLAEIINNIQHKAENASYIPNIGGIAVLGTELKHFFDEQMLVIEINNNLARPVNLFIKKLFDCFVATMVLAASLIPILAISVLIRLTSRGPAVFKQERIGKGGKNFVCYKFRTMYLDADERLKEILDGDAAAREQWKSFMKLKNDPRVTGFGRFLRKTSLDELPQIFNVLKGQMSLVGPRPYLPREWEYLKHSSELILNVPPGVTGLWQISGRNDKTFDERLAFDAWYVRNWNLWLDIVILLKTVKVVFKRQGAF